MLPNDAKVENALGTFRRYQRRESGNTLTALEKLLK